MTKKNRSYFFLEYACLEASHLSGRLSRFSVMAYTQASDVVTWDVMLYVLVIVERNINYNIST